MRSIVTINGAGPDGKSGFETIEDLPFDAPILEEDRKESDEDDRH